MSRFNPNNTNSLPISEFLSLLADCKPASVLTRLTDEVLDELVPMRSYALVDMDCYSEALGFLEERLPFLNGTVRLEAEYIRSNIILYAGRIDEAILAAQRVQANAQEKIIKALALTVVATGYSQKMCWKSAENAIQVAINLAPENPRVRAAQARVELEADHRIEARRIYEQMQDHPQKWGILQSLYGRSYIAYLLGELNTAKALAKEAVNLSDEIVIPLYILAQVASAQENLDDLEKVIELLSQRSPRAEGLNHLRQEKGELLERIANRESSSFKRLVAFPSIVQRRDYCGPSSVELVLRYWNNGLSFTNDEIASHVKSLHGGTTIYRIREFFQIIGFDVIQSIVPYEKIKLLIDHNFPIIVQQAYSNSSHVVVVIGYDEKAGIVELQDPMTHIVTRLPISTLSQLRQVYSESAIIPFPRGYGLEKTLASLDIFQNHAVVMTDEAIMELDRGNSESAVGLMETAVRRLPEHKLSWIILLHAYLDLWREARNEANALVNEGGNNNGNPSDKADWARKQFLESLSRSKIFHPNEPYIAFLEGTGALLEGDYLKALEIFNEQSNYNEDDAFLYASIAECYYLIRQTSDALSAARQSLEIDPSLVAGNIWMSRSLVLLNQPEALYYAQAAVELNDENWLSYLAYAEALMLDPSSMEQSSLAFDRSMKLSPGNPEVMVSHAQWLFQSGLVAETKSEIEVLFHSEAPFSPMVEYQLHKLQCRISFSENDLLKAMKQVELLLEHFPFDPWGVQFYAAVQCEVLMGDNNPVPLESVAEIVDRYESAIDINHADPSVIRDYLNYLVELADGETLLQVIWRLRERYPDRMDLAWIYSDLLSRLSYFDQAVDLILEFLHSGNYQLSEADIISILKIFSYSVDAERVYSLLKESAVRKEIPESVDWERHLGLFFAREQSADVEFIKTILESVHNRNPRDAQVSLELGKLEELEERRESLFRTALFIEPNLSEAREEYASLLAQKGMYDQAIELINGHIHETQKLGIIYARSLYKKGFYEESASILEGLVKDQDLTVEVTSSDIDRIELLTDLWLSEMKSGWYQNAINTARIGTRLSPDDPVWLHHSALSHLRMGNLDRAQRFIKKAVSLGLEEEVEIKFQYELALSKHDEDIVLVCLDHLEAIQSLKTPNGSLTWSGLQRIKRWALDGLDPEILAFLQARNLSATGWAEAAMAALQGDNPNVGLLIAKKAINLDADLYLALLARAESFNRLGQKDDAESAFRSLRKLYPEKHEAYLFFSVDSILNDMLPVAIELADQAVSLGAYSTKTWAVRGLVNYFRGQPIDAFEDLKIAFTRCNDINRQKYSIYWTAYYAIQDQPNQIEFWRQEAQLNSQTHQDHLLVSKVLLQIGNLDK